LPPLRPPGGQGGVKGRLGAAMWPLYEIGLFLYGL
jgi:hypothetical protein